VTSAALTTWRTVRSHRIDELLSAHAAVGGQGPGRRWRTSQLNNALTLLLAAEFQGFARDLHDVVSSTFALWAAGGNARLEEVIRARLREGRQLDRGNAQPASLGSDFGRFGFDVWASLASRDPATATHQVHLEKLNDARNAIAHADNAKLQRLRTEGYPMTLATFRTWRQSMDGLAGTLDAETADRLANLFGQPAPW
jgi:hypothetical protein